MSEYRHITNLQKPYDAIDTKFLDVLGDYREGPPVRPTVPDPINFPPKTVEELIADNIVGIYSTVEALNTKRVKDLTGWLAPHKMLGDVLAE